ncbi:hypothetical protein CDL15_Pgr003841 [Punica granatum]|uniref:General transcription and DNA repair factor IIH subunit TFB4 n=1 Tax=Punica granatum TaxID=22663 RepID=A0A218XUZ7_PUNGR|nr:hypothetical protein CDL15_Pgr003841 [Punica granatum]
MASAPSKLYADDVSLLVVLLDTNPFFWSSSPLPFSKFISHVLAFLNTTLRLHQLNQVVVIATGYNCCDYIYDSSSATNQSSGTGMMPAFCSNLLEKLDKFVTRDEQLEKGGQEGGIASSLLSGSLSMALCCILQLNCANRLLLHRSTKLSLPPTGVFVIKGLLIWATSAQYVSPYSACIIRNVRRAGLFLAKPNQM